MGKDEEGKARIMAMRKLSEQEIERIVSLLREGKPHETISCLMGKPLPEDYKAILFDTLLGMKLHHGDTKKEYELIYADKEREV